MILAAHFGQPLAAGPAVEPALDPEMAGQSHRARIVARADREVDVRAVDIMEAERRPAIAAETARTEGRRHVDRAPGAGPGHAVLRRVPEGGADIAERALAPAALADRKRTRRHSSP